MRRVSPAREDVAAEARAAILVRTTPVADRVMEIGPDMMQAERDTFIAMRDKREIDDVVYARLQNAIDLIDAGRNALLGTDEE